MPHAPPPLEPTPAPRPARGRPATAAAAAAAAVLLMAGCVQTPTTNVLETFAGEWCTLRGLAVNSDPIPGQPFVGMVLFEEGGQVFGTGSASPPDSDTIYASQYAGDISGNTATISRSDLSTAEAPGPQFTVTLTRESDRDLVGTMTGDEGFSGPLHLVRLGPRCFVE